MEQYSDVCAACQTVFSNRVPSYETESDSLIYRCKWTYLQQSKCPMCVQIRTFLKEGARSHSFFSGLFQSRREGPATGDEVEVHFQHQVETRGDALEKSLSLQYDPDPESRAECSRLYGQMDLLNRKGFLARLRISSPAVVRSRYFDLAADDGSFVFANGCLQPLIIRREPSGGLHQFTAKTSQPTRDI
jgi:hypothetical protein